MLFNILLNSSIDESFDIIPLVSIFKLATDVVVTILSLCFTFGGSVIKTT